MPQVRYAHLPTEQRHPRSQSLDTLSPLRLLTLMNQEDARVVRSLKRVLGHVACAVELISQAMRRGGRIFFIGAGTSGRLGVIEAAECPPTFHTPPSLVQTIIAGGSRAVFRSQEGSEDDRASARKAVRQRVRSGDIVVGISASGVTPFVDEALKAAKRSRARTILITCHSSTRMAADVRIILATGPEILSGSTRLKAGTATKLVLNMLTLCAMVKLGKTYGNLMVDVRPTSRKLRARALGIIQSIARCDAGTAERTLAAARGRTKLAALMATRNLSYRSARDLLAKAQGSLRNAV
jgi:N-acetylmuramic acid 6-phosphate etherase